MQSHVFKFLSLAVATITFLALLNTKLQLTYGTWRSRNYSTLGSIGYGNHSMEMTCVLYYDSKSSNNSGNVTMENCVKTGHVDHNYFVHNYTRKNDTRVYSTKELQEEKFTVVIPTYNRLSSLLSLIKDLNRTPNLDKVLVIWNNPKPPANDTHWPKIHVQVQVITNGRNSLNNKNLPFPQIRTEAILHHDDDIKLTKEEILSAFRVWQVNRDNMVGYFRRSIYLNKNKSYNYAGSATLANNSFPIILAGCCFVSKYYSYAYSYKMPQVIRDKVDKKMNCEDIALSFLVAHTIHKPPVLVILKGLITQRPGKGKALHSRPGHYQRRSRCANEFVKIYGYMPLKSTAKPL